MHFTRFYILLLVVISVTAKRRRKVAPVGCSFDGKKKQDKACNPFWKIKQPNCHAINAHRIKRTECSKKFCWKIVDNKTRKGNENIPSEGSLLLSLSHLKPFFRRLPRHPSKTGKVKPTGNCPVRVAALSNHPKEEYQMLQLSPFGPGQGKNLRVITTVASHSTLIGEDK